MNDNTPPPPPTCPNGHHANSYGNCFTNSCTYRHRPSQDQDRTPDPHSPR